MEYLYVAYFLFLGKASIDDIKYRIVKKPYNIIIISIIKIIIEKTVKRDITMTFSKLIIELILVFLISFIFLILAIYKNSMGGGDIKYIFAILLFMGVEKGVSVLAINFILIAVYIMGLKFLRKDMRKGIPMLPFLFFSNLIIVTKEIL